MFDEADLVALPRLFYNPGHNPSRVYGVYQGAQVATVKNSTRVGEANSINSKITAGVEAGKAVPKNTDSSIDNETPYVVQACAMRNDNVALAMSDGTLCHTKFARTLELFPEEERQWPHWTSWPSRHGSVLQLEFAPAQHALFTLEVTINH